MPSTIHSMCGDRPKPSFLSFVSHERGTGTASRYLPIRSMSTAVSFTDKKQSTDNPLAVLEEDGSGSGGRPLDQWVGSLLSLSLLPSSQPPHTQRAPYTLDSKFTALVTSYFSTSQKNDLHYSPPLPVFSTKGRSLYCSAGTIPFPFSLSLFLLYHALVHQPCPVCQLARPRNCTRVGGTRQCSRCRTFDPSDDMHLHSRADVLLFLQQSTISR